MLFFCFFFGSSTIICQKTKDVIITTNSGARFLLLCLNMPVSVSVLYIWSPILPLSAFVTFPSVQVTFANVTFSSCGWYISRTSSCLHWVHSTRTLPNLSAEMVIAHKSFAVCPIGFIGRILTFERPEEGVASANGILLHHPLICFEFLPNVTLQILELLLLSNSLQESADTCPLHCREVHLNVSTAPCITSSGLRVLSWLHGYYKV